MIFKKFIHPQTVIQNSSESITKNGLYDMSKFSKDELDTVISVLCVAYSDKYTEDIRSLGLINEIAPITYKPRYILLEILIKLFDTSKHPYDLLAVAEAYRLKGAAYRAQALDRYEKYLSTSSVIQRQNVNKMFSIFSNLFLYNNLSETYEKEHNLYRALKYAELAENLNTDRLPYYPIHVSKILLKIKPEEAVSYLLRTLETGNYRSVEASLHNALQDAKQKASAGYRYKPRSAKAVEDDFDRETETAALLFLPGGQYYSLWAKRKKPLTIECQVKENGVKFMEKIDFRKSQKKKGEKVKARTEVTQSPPIETSAAKPAEPICYTDKTQLVKFFADNDFYVSSEDITKLCYCDKITTAKIQRTLAYGYARAAKVVDLLKENGYLVPAGSEFIYKWAK